jgi:hypothetical protein
MPDRLHFKWNMLVRKEKGKERCACSHGSGDMHGQ